MKPNLKCKQVAKLRTNTWADCAIQASQLSAKEFQVQLIGTPGEMGVEVDRWRRGRQAVGPQTVDRTAKRLLEKDVRRLAVKRCELEALCEELGEPVERAQELERHVVRRRRQDGSAELYRLPLWKLLDICPLTDDEIFKVCVPFLNGSPRDAVWRFPYDFMAYERGKAIHQIGMFEVEHPPVWAVPHLGRGIHKHEVLPVRPWDDSDQLYQRGDTYGFIGILAALRYAANNGDTRLANHHCANAHRALVSLGRAPTFNRYWKRLAVAVYRLQRFLGVDEIAPSLSTIQQRIEAPQYLPSPSIITSLKYSDQRNIESERVVSPSSMVVSAKKHQVVREAGRAGQYSRPPQLWALRPIDRPAGSP